MMERSQMGPVSIGDLRGTKLSAIPIRPFRVVVMPAYQAERTLRQTVGDLPTDSVDHILVVDDCSVDGTVALARSLGLDVRTRSSNGGYGANQKTCYEEALRLGATVVVLLPADYQYHPRAVPQLIGPITAGDADMTFGSRFADRADPRAGGMPTYRYYGNRITTWVENRLLGTHFTETHSGMRAYSRAVLMAMPIATFSDDFFFDTQMLVAVHQSGFRIAEVPIPTRYTRDSSSIGIRRSLVYVGQSTRLCWRARKEGRGA